MTGPDVLDAAEGFVQAMAAITGPGELFCSVAPGIPLEAIDEVVHVEVRA
jgi:hypothetical protein